MRDPARIERILNKFKEFWSALPDLRFVQLLYDYFYIDGQLKFYDEDNKIEDRLDYLIKRMREKDKI